MQHALLTTTPHAIAILNWNGYKLTKWLNSLWVAFYGNGRGENIHRNMKFTVPRLLWRLPTQVNTWAFSFGSHGLESQIHLHTNNLVAHQWRTHIFNFPFKYKHLMALELLYSNWIEQLKEVKHSIFGIFSAYQYMRYFKFLFSTIVFFSTIVVIWKS